LVQADAARLPFASGSFDVVVARHVLWAFDDPTRSSPAGCGGWDREGLWCWSRADGRRGGPAAGRSRRRSRVMARARDTAAATGGHVRRGR
jgi:hypothetical protein